MVSIARTVCFTSAVALLLVGQGCVTQKQPKTTAVAPNEFESPSQTQKPHVIDMTHAPKSGQYFDVDACADRLHTIAGQLLTYYAIHRELPRDLAELAKYADAGETTDYTCPTSHQSYVYVPSGLALNRDVSKGILILYDAKPVHDSTEGPMRWGVLFSEAHGRQPPDANIIPIPEKVMPGFLPVPPHPVVVPRQSVPAAQQQ